jgi:hypothetical protein
MLSVYLTDALLEGGEDGLMAMGKDPLAIRAVEEDRVEEDEEEDEEEEEEEEENGAEEGNKLTDFLRRLAGGEEISPLSPLSPLSLSPLSLPSLSPLPATFLPGPSLSLSFSLSFSLSLPLMSLRSNTKRVEREGSLSPPPRWEERKSLWDSEKREREESERERESVEENVRIGF